jgi:hypothetical protein
LEALNNLTLADVIKRNTGIENIQDNVMKNAPQAASIAIEETVEAAQPQGASGDRGAVQASVGQAQSMEEMIRMMMQVTELMSDSIRLIADAVSQGRLR